MNTPMDEVYESARNLGGIPHGDDGVGWTDITFPGLIGAALFARMYYLEAQVRLREPVDVFNVPVVVQIKLNGQESQKC